MGYFWFGLPEYLAPWVLNELGAQTAFIETGTYLGATAAWASQHFAQVDTIEMDPTLFRDARLTLSGTSVSCHLGDSRKVLPRLLSAADTGLLVWLDAHFSGGPTAGVDDPCPVLGELDILLEHRSPDRTIVAIDDARLFVGAGGYPPLDELGFRLTGAGWAWLVLDDIIVASSRDHLRTLHRESEGWRQIESGSLSSVWPGVLAVLQLAGPLRKARAIIKKRR